MKISDNYRLVFDENNVTLQYFEMREKTKRDGTKELYEYQSNTFHGSVKQALKAVLKQSINGSESVKELISRIEAVENKIDSLQINNHEVS